MARRSASAKQLAALARGRAVLAMRRSRGAGSFGAHNLVAARAARKASPWSRKATACGFRKSSKRCRRNPRGKRVSPKCRINKKSHCVKRSRTRRALPSKSRRGLPARGSAAAKALMARVRASRK